jgi:hypothetical protein
MTCRVIWFLRSAAVACGVALTAVVFDLIASANAPKIGNCFPPGSWGDQWVGTLGAVGFVAGGVAVITGLVSTVAPGHRAFSIVLVVLGAGAALYCVGAGIGNAICEY